MQLRGHLFRRLPFHPTMTTVMLPSQLGLLVAYYTLSGCLHCGSITMTSPNMSYFNREELERLYREGDESGNYSHFANKIVTDLDQIRRNDDDTSILRNELMDIFSDETLILEMSRDLMDHYNNRLPESNKEKVEFIGELPFFACPRPPRDSAIGPNDCMSMNTTDIERSATKRARRFEVYFGECGWDDLEELPELAAGVKVRKIPTKITQTLNLTYLNITRKNDEDTQMYYFVDCINPLLSLFGYIGHHWTARSNPDLKIQKEDDPKSVVILGEAKKVANLPHTNLDSALSKALLLFGFSTKIFKEQWAADPESRQTLVGIQSLLKLRKPSKSLSSNDNDIQLSTMAEGLLAN
eukprot:scaffold421147_cov47-Attheya_sp.AAC.4